VLVLLALVVLASCAATIPSSNGDLVRAYPESPQQRNGVFVNPALQDPSTPPPAQSPGVFGRLGLLWKFLFDKPPGTVPPGPLPLQHMTQAAVLAAPDNTVWRLGHSTLLLKIAGTYWLTDPIFSERASPVQWAGPKRFHPPPVSIDQLPPIEGVILSHDHYDHLDVDTIMALAPRVRHFVTPLGVGDRLIDWGVDPGKVRQLDWWETTEVGAVRLAAVPARHFSGRGLNDRNKTLWASWVVLAGDVRLFFSGDTGYHPDFRTIGERYGPFDMAMLEVGAYSPSWQSHMQPHESLRAAGDLRAKWLLPVHNGTFDLSTHTWDDPFERITALGAAQGVPVATPQFGEALPLLRPHAGSPWWRTVGKLPGTQ